MEKDFTDKDIASMLASIAALGPSHGLIYLVTEATNLSFNEVGVIFEKMLKEEILHIHRGNHGAMLKSGN